MLQSRKGSGVVVDGADGEREGEGAADAADDKLYCICKTSYDEDRVMIACDRCVSVSLVPLPQPLPVAPRLWLIVWLTTFVCAVYCCRCDEWYHTSCVNMPDLEVDLVDQFICPVCIASTSIYIFSILPALNTSIPW